MAKPAAKNQMTILGVVLAGILGVIGYLYRDALLPQAQPGAEVRVTAAPWKPPATGFSKAPLFARPDFLGLKQFGDVPVRVLQEQGTDPFKSL